MNNNLKYTIEIITNADKLIEAFSLRYNVYKKAFPSITANSKELYESDAFDCRSIHLGLYCENDTERKLAGYSRLVVPPFFSKRFFKMFVNCHPVYNYQLLNSATQNLPLVSVLPDANYYETINSYCNKLEFEKKVYFETSRFIISEQYRSLSISSFFVRGMMAIARSLQLEYSFFACYVSHSAFYKKVGLTPFSNLCPFDCKPYPDQQINLFGSDLTTKNCINSCYLRQLKQLESNGQISYYKAA